MSIPPLVCSTPPPPDQCEDDKDPEDFDLHYSLSQEDDYDFGSFSTYNHFQTAISVNKPLSDPVVDHVETNDIEHNGSTTTEKKIPDSSVETKLSNKQKQEIVIKVNNDSSTDIECEVNTMAQQQHEEKDEENLHIDKKVTEEDLNIEDLNLSIEEDSINPIVKNEFYDNPDSDKSDSSDKEKSDHIPDIASSIIASDPNETVHIDEITPPSIDDINDPQHSIEDLKMDDEHSTDYNDIKNEPYAEPEPEHNFEDPTETQDSKPFNKVSNEVNNDTDDEFGDFNDFHSTLTLDNKAATVIDACDNPWEANQPDLDFGAFEAHFDDTGNTEKTLFQDFTSKVEESDPNNQLGSLKVLEDNDDEFGDFDDFKSSAQEATDKEERQDPLSQVPVLDFQTSESEGQVLENINRILNSVFEEDIPEPESVFDGKLEALLCETWGHLLETDVRQPYIVNWNSSIGQKTLLKALCIDSRNILFGPKWSYNMPKYAANLSAAPLQPQKQTTPSGPIQSETSEKHGAKTLGTWSDPFTSDGQESCNKESSDTAQKRPTDLNVFDTALSTKADKIYSSTLDVQPIRQISLPDTHIFTPTDSETPRSKTIHYNGPPVFMSQSSVDNDKKPTNVTTSETTTDATVLDDADYSDFQDFKGSYKTDAPEVKAIPADVAEPLRDARQLPSTGAATSVAILQPIKLEPLMPTLNWPSPGEVKDTFDDFSEFTSSITWSNDIQETQIPTMIQKTQQNDNIDIINDKSIKNKETTPSNINDSFDDDFDTFQSALPTDQPAEAAASMSNFNDFVSGDFSKNMASQGTLNREQELDLVFQKKTIKSDPISLTKSNDILNASDTFLQQNNVTTSILTTKEPIVKVPAMHTLGPPMSTALQPTMSSSQTQQNSAQILQPLSLESFSQINWPNPGINLQDLSRFNPVETLNSLKSDLTVSGSSKNASPVHTQKNSVQNPPPEEDIWGDFVSSKPKPQQSLPKKATTFVDDDEWTDFVSSPAVKPQNGLNTISLNVHTNLSVQKSSKQPKANQALEIPITHYITPKSSSHSSYNDRHFQNL